MRCMKRALGTALMLNAEVCLRVRAGDGQQVVLDVLVIDASATGMTWLITVDRREAITVWTTTGMARVVFLGAWNGLFRFTVLAPPAVVVRPEEQVAETVWGIPHRPFMLNDSSVGVVA